MVSHSILFMDFSCMNKHLIKNPAVFLEVLRHVAPQLN